MTKVVGIPRGMHYFEYFPLWMEYFKELNIDTILSPKTNKDILNEGILNCVDEACLPVKIFHGHVNYLKDKVDYIFIPKYMSLHKREYCCPKHLGLPEMVKHNIDGLPKIISPIIDLGNKKGFKNAAAEINKVLRIDRKDNKRALCRGIKAQKEYNSRLYSEIIPKYDKEIIAEDIKILVLGHPYNVYDELINMGVLKKLIQNNVKVVFAEDISEENCRKYSSSFSKRIFWTQGRNIVGSAYYLLENKLIDGIIYLSAFGCGLDSVLIYLVEKKAIEENIPIMTLTLDEQTGEAGFVTRYEAFLDMMEWRLKNEDYISSFR